MKKNTHEMLESLTEQEKKLVDSIYNIYLRYDYSSWDFRNGIIATIFEIYAHNRRGISRDLL